MNLQQYVDPKKAANDLYLCFNEMYESCVNEDCSRDKLVKLYHLIFEWKKAGLIEEKTAKKCHRFLDRVLNETEVTRILEERVLKAEQKAERLAERQEKNVIDSQIDNQPQLAFS